MTTAFRNGNPRTTSHTVAAGTAKQGMIKATLDDNIYQRNGMKPFTFRRYSSYSEPNCSIIALSSKRAL
jgi:hypothetical protein